jgi:hypothetical protein
MAIGIITSVAGSPKGIRAKLKIAEMLDVLIDSVELFKSQSGIWIQEINDMGISMAKNRSNPSNPQHGISGSLYFTQYWL